MKRFLFIFAFCFPFLFGLKSYASPTFNGGQVYSSPLVYRAEYNYYLTTSSGFIAGYYDPINYQVVWYSKDSTPIFLNGTQSYNSGALRTAYYTVDNTVDVFSDLSLLQSALLNAHSSAYDEFIGIGGKFWLLQSGGLANQMTWGAMWKYDDVSDFQLTIVGSKKTDKFDFTDNGGYWFDPFDYGVLGEQITLYLTPFDSSGNWGNTLSLSKGCYFSLSDAIAQPFQGYVRKASNDVDIVGIDDTDVIIIKEKPDGTGVITSPTVITTTTVYSPVYQTTNQQSVVTYVENNYYTTNNYYETNNQINDNTTFTPDLNFDNSDDDNYVNAKNFLISAPEKILSVFQVFAGTPFEPILTLLVVGFSVLTGAALVLVLCKILGVIP